VLGAIASGALLYGISWIYGVTGSIQFDEIAALLSSDPSMNRLPIWFGLAFVIVGIAFKFGAVPFHMWLPDVYHGARSPVTLYVATAPKIAAFALTIRILVDALGELHGVWNDMIMVVAVLSLLLGNIVAIAQTNIKRMLAYSTIAHVGFLFLGVIATTFPIAIESTARMISIWCQSPCMTSSPSTSRRMSMPNAASFGAEPMNRVTGVAAPSYTSGTHMWKGTAPSLKATPTRTNTSPSASTRLPRASAPLASATSWS